MSVTARLGLHRPVGADGARVPYDLTQLTDQLDELTPYRTSSLATRPAATAVPPGTIFRDTTIGGVSISNGTVWMTLSPPTVAALSSLGTPDLGEEAYLQASGLMATNKMRWRIKKESSGWSFVDGPSLSALESNTTTQTFNGTTLLTSGPNLSVPYTGTYRVSGLVGIQDHSSAALSVAIRIVGVTDIKAIPAAVSGAGGILYPLVSVQSSPVSLTAAQVVDFYGESAAPATATFGQRSIELTPITFS